MLLITIFVELRVVVGRSRKRAGSPQPSLDGRAVPWPREERHGMGTAWAWHGKCESHTAALCKSSGKDTF